MTILPASSRCEIIFLFLRWDIHEPFPSTQIVVHRLARCVQYLANLKLDKFNDSKLKEILEANIPKMRAFLEQASVLPKDTYVQDVSGYIDLERELASYYHHLVHHSVEVFEKTPTQKTRDDLSDSLDEVSGKYEEKWPTRSTPYQYKISLAKAAMFLSS